LLKISFTLSFEQVCSRHFPFVSQWPGCESVSGLFLLALVFSIYLETTHDPFHSDHSEYVLASVGCD
jgi:hypothetical protein